MVEGRQCQSRSQLVHEGQPLCMLMHAGGVSTMAAPTEQYQASDLAQIGRGLYYIGEDSIRPADIGKISGRCITCRQQIWKGTGSTDGVLRLTFRKCTMKGYLVSCGVPKNKQRKHIICLACVGKLMGELRVGADAGILSLCERAHGQQEGLLFERLPSGSWKQQLELTDELLEGAVAANESSVSRKKPKKAAADTQRGLQAGKRPRAEPISACGQAYFLLRFYVQIDQMPEANNRVWCRCSKRRKDMQAISNAADAELFGSAEFTMHILPGLIETFRSLPLALRVQIRKMFDSSNEAS
jgi:hypothetical protein